MTTTIRIDSVTRRFFDLLGKNVDGWIRTLQRQKYPFGRTGKRVWVQPAAGNPCSEIPCQVPSDIDLLSYQMVDNGRIDGHAPVDGELPSMRIMGGRIHLGGGAVFSAQGDSIDQTDARLTINGHYPDTILHSLVGGSALAVCDATVLTGASVTGFTREGDDVVFTLDVPWETIESAVAPAN